ncbi:MAG: glycerol-3-phosphate acyltransferase [Chloroflexi bacterium]|nr:MAG: glycerol-3-phosphate acyltransferase [Chloroflexota bacterium]
MFNNYHLDAISVVVVSYLIGSIPTAYLIGRLKGINIFAIGSGNMGATNVQRSLGSKWGLIVWGLDALKGIAAILLAQMLLPDSRALAATIAGVVGVIGHNWSLFATLITGRVRGGKGAAISFGTMLMIAPLYVLVGVFIIGGIVVARTRYVSLGVLVMALVSTIWLLILIDQQRLAHEYIYYALGVTALVFYRHKENIQRLLAGTERRIGDHA